MSSGVVTTLYPDKNDKTIIAHSYQDCQEILDQNALLRDAPNTLEWGRLVARVPNNIIHQWLVEEWSKGNTDIRPFTRRFNVEVVQRKLRDPNYKYLLV